MVTARPSRFTLVSALRGRRWLVASALILAIASQVPAVEPLRVYRSLTLKDGRTLSDVRVINYTSTDVLVRHVGGATSLSAQILPESVLADLHLPLPAAAPAFDPAFLALADKVAVAATPAPASVAPTIAKVDVVPSETNVSAEQLQAAATARPTTTPAPAGEGNFVEAIPLVTPAPVIEAAPRNTWTTIPGRIAITAAPGDTRFIRGVEVRAYPADLLARYLDQARLTAAQQAQPLREQAASLAQEGRTTESMTLAARAARLVDNYLDLLPVAPYSARTDEFGHFTLRHDLRDARLVAVGRIASAAGEWTYAWIGLTPDGDAILTEANASAVTAPAASGATFAAR